MYGLLWTALPGGRVAKTIQCLILFVAVVWLLFRWVFPWLEPRLPFIDVTVQTTTSSPSPSG